MVLHECDNPPCCNPAHLFDGSVLDNNRDARDKGRYTHRPSLRTAESYTHGTNVHTAKLSDADVMDIRQRFTQGQTIMEIRDEVYPHVTWENISQIVKRKTWKHLP